MTSPVVLALVRSRQMDEKLRVIFCYIVSLRSTKVTQDPVSNKKKEDVQ